MIAAQRDQLAANVSQKAVGIELAELSWYMNNLNTVSGLSSAFSGMGFFLIVFHLFFDVEGQKAAYLFLLSVTVTMCTNFLAVTCCTLCTMFAPGMALRGPQGSIHTAITSLRGIHKWILRLFFTGIVFMAMSLVALIWLRTAATPSSVLYQKGLCDGAARNASQIDSFFITEQLEYAQCAAVKEDLRIKALIVSGALLSIIMCAVSFVRNDWLYFKIDHGDKEMSTLILNARGDPNTVESNVSLDNQRAVPMPPSASRAAPSAHPAVCPTIEAAAARTIAVRAQGYLVKRGHRIKNWKRRHFELHAGDSADPEDSPPTLTYAATSGGKTLGVVKLVDVEVISADRDVHRMHSFIVRRKANKAGASYDLVLTSHSADDKARWMHAIRQVAISGHGAQLLDTGAGANAARHV